MNDKLKKNEDADWDEVLSIMLKAGRTEKGGAENLLKEAREHFKEIEGIIREISARSTDASTKKERMDKRRVAKLAKEVSELELNPTEDSGMYATMRLSRRALEMLMASPIKVMGRLFLDPRVYEYEEACQVAKSRPQTIRMKGKKPFVIHPFVDKYFAIPEGTVIDRDLVMVACKLCRYLHAIYDVAISEFKDYWPVMKDLEELLDLIIERNINRKCASMGKPGQPPLDLNDELTMAGYLEHRTEVMSYLKVKLLGIVNRKTDVRNESRNLSQDFGVANYCDLLYEHGKFGQMLKAYEDRPTHDFYEISPERLEDARKRLGATITFGTDGFPRVDGYDPQYPWADLNKYAAQFDAIDLEDDEAMEQRLGIFKRASVAELLRKLINRDKDYGESQDASTTSVGLMTQSRLDGVDRKGIFNETGGVFLQNSVPVADLYEPLKRVLAPDVDRYQRELEERYGKLGAGYELWEPRIKPIDSILSKMMKDGRDVILDITDLLGFTIITRTEEEAKKVFDEIKGKMRTDKNMVVYDKTWTNPYPETGRRSLDITGVPEGYEKMMQVQVRTKKVDKREEGMLSNHLAYKVRTGGYLKEKVDSDPGKYLDLLYRALHKLRCAYEECRKNPEMEEKEILRVYGKKYEDGLSVVRTSTLYK